MTKVGSLYVGSRGFVPLGPIFFFLASRTILFTASAKAFAEVSFFGLISASSKVFARVFCAALPLLVYLYSGALWALLMPSVVSEPYGYGMGLLSLSFSLKSSFSLSVSRASVRYDVVGVNPSEKSICDAFFVFDLM